MGKQVTNKTSKNVADAPKSKDDTDTIRKKKKASVPGPSSGIAKLNKAENPIKNRKIVVLNDTPPTQEGSQKRKKKGATAEEAPLEDDEVSEGVPTKKVKEDSRTITAGTTIDQVPGIKLRNKKSKREKHAKHLDSQRKKSRNKEHEEVLDYLQTWKSNREKWRFEKLKQIYIQTHIFDESLIDADIFPIALEYLSGTRGSSKENLRKSAESIIRELDAVAVQSKDDVAEETGKYQRAREILQSIG